MLDVWVGADGTEILDRSKLEVPGKEYIAGQWYSSEEIGLWLKCRNKKWRLDDFDKAHARLK